MRPVRTLVTCALGVVFLADGIQGQGFSQYRNFALGSSLTSVSSVAGIAASEARTIHERPAKLQNLEWRPPSWIAGASTASTDPVEQIVFSFYDDQLFRIVVDYRSDRTEGMTDADMIDAISSLYGTSIKRMPGAPARINSPIESQSGSPLSRWAGEGTEAALYRSSSYSRAFRLIVSDPSLDDRAKRATIQALRLDEQEAPKKEVARQEKEKEDGRAAAEKAREANKSAFRP